MLTGCCMSKLSLGILFLDTVFGLGSQRFVGGSWIILPTLAWLAWTSQLRRNWDSFLSNKSLSLDVIRRAVLPTWSFLYKPEIDGTPRPPCSLGRYTLDGSAGPSSSRCRVASGSKHISTHYRGKLLMVRSEVIRGHTWIFKRSIFCFHVTEVWLTHSRKMVSLLWSCSQASWMSLGT